MTKKKVTTEAKAAKEVKEKTVKSPVKETKQKTEDVVEPTDSNVGNLDSAGSTISSSEGKDTSEQKESLTGKENETKGLSFEEADQLMNEGGVVALPEWEGFWFKNIKNPKKTFVLTKDNLILDTPHEEYKERNDWQAVEPNEEQLDLLSRFHGEFETEQKDKKAKKEYDSLKAVSFNRSKGGSFIKLKDEISIEDLSKRQNLPLGSSRNSEFLMSNGHIFDLQSGVLTNKKA